MEAAVGFEPTSKGFADLSLKPLGYAAILGVGSIIADARGIEKSWWEGFRACLPEAAHRAAATTRPIQFVSYIWVFQRFKNRERAHGGAPLRQVQ